MTNNFSLINFECRKEVWHFRWKGEWFPLSKYWYIVLNQGEQF